MVSCSQLVSCMTVEGVHSTRTSICQPTDKHLLTVENTPTSINIGLYTLAPPPSALPVKCLCRTPDSGSCALSLVVTQECQPISVILHQPVAEACGGRCLSAAVVLLMRTQPKRARLKKRPCAPHPPPAGCELPALGPDRAQTWAPIRASRRPTNRGPDAAPVPVPLLLRL